MGGHVKRNFNVTSTPVGRMVVDGKLSWPTRPLGSSSKPTNTNHGSRDRQVVTVPDFVSRPQDFLPSKYGYQEVHGIYDQMRNFFAKRATSTHQNEVATIKVTLMSMKPNNRNPQMVMVCKITMACILNMLIIQRTSRKPLRTFLSASGLAISKRSHISPFSHCS
jgi:hypothetical protein